MIELQIEKNLLRHEFLFELNIYFSLKANNGWSIIIDIFVWSIFQKKLFSSFIDFNTELNNYILYYYLGVLSSFISL